MTSAGGIGPGTVLAGTWEITGVLGRGGMGVVWAAKHRRLPGKRAAIKVLLSGATDEQSLARFQREAEVVSRIGHPNIVEVLDFNTIEDGTPYQVLEYLEGETLGARLRRGPVPLAQALDYTRQVASALAAAHRAGVVHRDLKPDNIFLCPTDAGGVVGERVRVLDFGISKIRGSQTVQTQDSVLVGTPQYMSPEQASGKNQQVDGRTDVFALGAIVYEMLSGQAAFAGEDVISVLAAVLMNMPEPLAKRGVPLQVSAAVERALAKDANQRFADVGTFVTALTGKPLETLDGRGPPVDAMAATVAPSQAVPSMGVALTMPSAELAPAPARTTPAGGGKFPVVPVALGAVVLGVVVAVVQLRREGSFAPVRQEPAAASHVPPPPVVTGSVPAVPDAARAVERPPTDVPASKPEKPVTKGRGIRDEAPSGAVSAELAEAQALLDQGDTRGARRKAEHSLLEQRTSRAFSILARAACRERDVAAARAALRNVGGADRAAVLRACAADGQDLK